ncbi:MAG TPA: peptidylprolyl isomerase [Bdellovibrionales bacterium]|nr:peptidylprolyl isomerase [Bdellovibrionales bacterium]
MQASQDHVVSIEYTLKNAQGEVLDSSGDQPFSYLHGAQNIVPGLEKALEGKAKGDQLEVNLKPEEGYGPRRDELMSTVDKSELDQIPNIEEGMQLQAQTPQGIQIFTVTEVTGDKVTLDGNHPLAGHDLNFSVTVIDIRKATSEELEHGHVHGPGGHHH